MLSEIRPVAWDQVRQELVLIDQTQLPAREVTVSCATVDEVIDAIGRMVVRGAPALGAVGAYGVAVAMLQADRQGWTPELLDARIEQLRQARPTAVNLAWGVDRVRQAMPLGIDGVLAEANRVMAEDEAANHALSIIGADWIGHRTGKSTPLRILTHCNAGALATTAWGTALGIVRELHARGQVDHVIADETRPLLQGSRLTAWELQREGIEVFVQADAAATSTIMRGLVDVAIIGADRIARNGDTANKIGSLGVALACHEARIPFVVAAPSSTVDLSTPSGEGIDIELRAGTEVTGLAGVRTAPEGVTGLNPAFDVTPWRFISAIVTESGIVEPDGQPIDRLAERGA